MEDNTPNGPFWSFFPKFFSLLAPFCSLQGVPRATPGLFLCCAYDWDHSHPIKWIQKFLIFLIPKKSVVNFEVDTSIFAFTYFDYFFRLVLPDNMTSEYRLLPVEWLTEIWRPDSFFKNAKSVTFQTMTIPNHYIWLYKDKSILYMVK